MGKVKWIKVSTDMFESNRKIKQIELMPEGDTILVIWLKLLLLAGNVNDGGNIYLTPEIPYTDEMLANELRRPLATVRMALSLFERFSMIEIIDDILHLSSWEKYQSTDKLAEIREQTRKRVAKCRENKRLAECNVTSNATSNGCNAIEEEKEEKKEKESHSFTLSREEAKLKYLGGTLGKGVVMLSDEQFDDLCEKLSFEELNKYIGIVADRELNGKPYKKKTDYQANLEMVNKDRKDNK
jgi:predicted phage replisome organizer